MTIAKTIGRTIGRAVLTVGAVTVGTALAAFSRTTKGKELRRAVEEKVTSGIAAVRARFFGGEPGPVTETMPDAVERSAKVEHEHALEHGPEGRKWASNHAHRPHAPEAPPLSTGLRFAAMRRVARHV